MGKACNFQTENSIHKKCFLFLFGKCEQVHSYQYISSNLLKGHSRAFRTLSILQHFFVKIVKEFKLL